MEIVDRRESRAASRGLSSRFFEFMFSVVCSTLFDNDSGDSSSFPVAECTFCCSPAGLFTMDCSPSAPCDVESCTGNSTVLISVGQVFKSLSVTKLEVDRRLFASEAGDLKRINDTRNHPATTTKMKRVIRKSMRFRRVLTLGLGCAGANRPSLGGTECCGSIMWAIMYNSGKSINYFHGRSINLSKWKNQDEKERK